MQQSDADLVAAAKRGDLASFGRLYERHYRLAVGVARGRLGDAHLAEDAAQEAFAVASRSLANLADGDKFPQWLGTICRRTASRLASAQTSHELLTDTAAPAGSDNPSALHRRVREVLEQLDETAREIVLLHYFSGLSHAEIAKALGLSASAVHGRLQRARHKLAKLLSPLEAKR